MRPQEQKLGIYVRDRQEGRNKMAEFDLYLERKVTGKNSGEWKYIIWSGEWKAITEQYDNLEKLAEKYGSRIKTELITFNFKQDTQIICLPNPVHIFQRKSLDSSDIDRLVDLLSKKGAS